MALIREIPQPVNLLFMFNQATIRCVLFLRSVAKFKKISIRGKNVLEGLTGIPMHPALQNSARTSKLEIMKGHSVLTSDFSLIDFYLWFPIVRPII